MNDISQPANAKQPKTPTPAEATHRSSPPLSPTECRVYSLLLQRLTERQVAEQMARSHNTVHVHVRNIYRKLGVRTRQELFDLPSQNRESIDSNP